jgi:hypothetical protein
MKVQLAVLADCANVAAGDKLNVMGVFDTIFAPQFPMAHAFMVLALRLKLEYEDGGKTHDLLIVLRDEDGREYLRAEAKANVGHVAPGEVQHVNQILNFAALGFTKPGHYAFVFHWNGKEQARVDLNVVPQKPAGA